MNYRCEGLTFFKVGPFLLDIKSVIGLYYNSPITDYEREKMNTLDYLTAISKNEKQFNKLYQAASEKYNLPAGSLWIMYFLIFSDEDVTQLDIAERMMLPKQTINSATSSLVERGLITLEKMQGSKKKKMILTKEGKDFADNTVKHILDAEKRAVKRMGTEKIKKYIELYNEFYDCMKKEFCEEDIIDG